MPKGLRLKRTPAEQAERDLRKARKAAKKAASRQRLSQDANFNPDGKRSVSVGDAKDDLDPTFLDPGPSTSRHGGHTAPVTDDSFHERLWDAFGDDERLDNIEARMNEYAYVPRRWGGVSPHASGPYTTDGGLDDDDPALMNDDEYAEWVRVGMWRYVLCSPCSCYDSYPSRRKRNAAAHREQQRQEAAHAAAKAEAARILKAKEDARRRTREERERRRRVEAKEAYRRRWIELLESRSETANLSFGDIPWPVGGGAPDISHLTAEAISAFLFEEHKELGLELDEAGRARMRKEELRGTMLRFHPDKFEGRIVRLVRDEERSAVLEGANAVTRTVAALM
jgi:hypothetical protein